MMTPTERQIATVILALEDAGVPTRYLAKDFIAYWVSRGYSAPQIVNIALNIPFPQRKTQHV